jgi:hypothetical protein
MSELLNILNEIDNELLNNGVTISNDVDTIKSIIETNELNAIELG